MTGDGTVRVIVRSLQYQLLNLNYENFQQERRVLSSLRDALGLGVGVLQA